MSETKGNTNLTKLFTDIASALRVKLKSDDKIPATEFSDVITYSLVTVDEGVACGTINLSYMKKFTVSGVGFNPAEIHAYAIYPFNNSYPFYNIVLEFHWYGSSVESDVTFSGSSGTLDNGSNIIEVTPVSDGFSISLNTNITGSTVNFPNTLLIYAFKESISSNTIKIV